MMDKELMFGIGYRVRGRGNGRGGGRAGGRGEVRVKPIIIEKPGGRIFAPIRLRRRGPHPDIVTIQYAPIHFFSPQPALAKPIRQRVVMKGVTPPTSADDHIATIPTFSQSVEGEDTNGAEEQQTQSPPYPKEFYVDVPMGVFPGESFRTSIADEEFLIVCPEIEEEGERIMVCISGGN